MYYEKKIKEKREEGKEMFYHVLMITPFIRQNYFVPFEASQGAKGKNLYLMPNDKLRVLLEKEGLSEFGLIGASSVNGNMNKDKNDVYVIVDCFVNKPQSKGFCVSRNMLDTTWCWKKGKYLSQDKTYLLHHDVLRQNGIQVSKGEVCHHVRHTFDNRFESLYPMSRSLHIKLHKEGIKRGETWQVHTIGDLLRVL